MNETPILAIESSASSCGVAVWFSADRNSQVMHKESRQHASKIILLTDSVLQNFKLKLEQIEAIAVSTGPGSFTGLRIGLSAAKGMCMGAQKPLIKVPTFDASAFQLRTVLNEGDEVWVTSKVNTTEFFIAKYIITGDAYEVLENVKALTHGDILAMMSGREFIAGESNWFNSQKYLNLECPSPLFVAKWAYEFGTKIEPDDIDFVEPDYYKDFIIKRKSV